MTKLTIRKATGKDIQEILLVMDAARAIMRSSGNRNQWTDGYPSSEIILRDISDDGAYVVIDNGEIRGYFALLPSPEPTYLQIDEGEWMEDSLPYHVIHRIASYPDTHGVFSTVIDFCRDIDTNIRIDTHRDNTIMQHNLTKHGFTYCGIIHLQNGDERLAYQIL